jgi:hypothetical protein
MSGSIMHRMLEQPLFEFIENEEVWILVASAAAEDEQIRPADEGG